MFKIVKSYYDKGVYNNTDVAKFVKAGRLTEDDYRSITGDSYAE